MTHTPLPGPRPVVLLGGTGRTGHRVHEQLVRRGATVRTASRSTEPRFDWQSPETWSSVLAGAGSAYISYAPDLAFPGAADTMAVLGQQARRHGLERLVLLSGRGEPRAARSEAALRAAGVPTAVIRSSWFAQNFTDAAAEISAAVGRDVDYVPVTPDEFVAGAVAAGIPEAEARPLATVFSEVLDGRNAFLTDDVRRVLGRPPADFAEYARRTAVTGVWDRHALSVAP